MRALVLAITLGAVAQSFVNDDAERRFSRKNMAHMPYASQRVSDDTPSASLMWQEGKVSKVRCFHGSGMTPRCFDGSGILRELGRSRLR